MEGMYSTVQYENETNHDVDVFFVENAAKRMKLHIFCVTALVYFRTVWMKKRGMQIGCKAGPTVSYMYVVWIFGIIGCGLHMCCFDLGR